MTRRLALHCCSTSASPGRRRALPWDQGGLPQPSRNRQRCDASSRRTRRRPGTACPRWICASPGAGHGHGTSHPGTLIPPQGSCVSALSRLGCFTRLRIQVLHCWK